MRIDVKWRREGDIAIASLLGRIDNTSSDRFLAMAEDGLESGDRALLLDFGRVSYPSSAGLRVCLILARKFSAPGQAIAICSLSALNREVVAVSGFDQMIPVHDTIESAIASLRDS
ncbi:MAG: STAS domain-containing protein [Chloroflexota bacterium]|nr:STAS domain-containing protein [Chloroflexota bacterium]